MLLLLPSFGVVTNLSAQDSLIVDSVVLSNRSGVENILQGNVAGLKVKSWSATLGSQSIINLRGMALNANDKSTMPLILVNGVPIIAGPSDITGINPLSYYAAEQIEKIEIIREIDALAAYGVQAPNGALNIIMKEGKTGSVHVKGSAFAGANFLQNMNYRKDAFYNFNTTGRRAVYGGGGIINEQNLIVDGAGEFGSYLFGLTNYQDKGVIKDANSGRQSLFLNAKYNISKKFSAHFYNNMALTNGNGRYAGDFNRNLNLPVIENESFFMDKNNNLGMLSSIGLNYHFNPKFKITSVAGLSYEGASRDVYVPSNVLEGNVYAASAAYKRQLITINTSLNYLSQLTGAWQMDMTLGNQIRNTDNKLTSVSGERSLENGGSNFVKVVTGYNANQTNALSDHYMEKLLSFYGIWKMKYKKDLAINVVLRTDGSTLYSNKWALYPALGLHYDLQSELEIPVKLNVAFGKTGALSQPEVYRGELGAYGDYFGGNELGIGQLYPAFTNAKSVGIYQLDAGLSIDLQPSLSLSLNYFNKNYQDFTYQRYLSNYLGTDYQYETGGGLSLKGLELSVDKKWINTKNFGWYSNFNVASYRNKVKKLPTDLENTSLNYLATLKKGDAVTSIVAFEGSQQKIIGNSEAKAFGGFSNILRYKNISASFTLSYAIGADIATESFDSKYFADMVGDKFPLKSAETPYYFQSFDSDGRKIYQGIRTIEDGSFIRLNKAAVSYNLGSFIKGLSSLSDMEIFVRGDNLFTLSKYSGLNPEENITGIRKTDLSLTGTPLPSSVVMGVKLIF